MRALTLTFFLLVFFKSLTAQNKIEWIIPLEKQLYDELRFFVDSLAVVKVYNLQKEGNTGNPFLDKMQLEIQRANYGRDSHDGYYGVINMNNKIVIDTIYNSISIKEKNIIIVTRKGLERNNKLVGCFDFNGNQILPVKYKNLSLTSSSLFSTPIFQYQENRETKYIDHKGNPLKLCEDGLPGIKNNLIRCSSQINKRTSMECFYDTLYTLVGCRYSRNKLSEDRGMILKKDGKWGLVDEKDNSIKIPYDYDSLIVFNMHNYLIYLENNKWGVIDENGKKMTEAIYDRIAWKVGDTPYKRIGNYSYKTTYFEKEGYGGILNDELKETVNFKDKYCFHERQREDRYWFQEKNGSKWGVINGETGEIIVDPIYDKGDVFSGGFSYINKNEKVGLVDKNGKILFPPEYEFVYRNGLNEGVCVFKKGNEVFVIDRSSGNLLFSKKDVNIRKPYFRGKERTPGKKGDVLVFFESGNSKFGVISKKGKVILPPEKYDNIELFEESNIYVYEINGKLGLVLPNDEVIPAKYNRVRPPYLRRSKKIENYIGFDKNGFWGIMDLSGKEILPAKYVSYEINEGEPYFSLKKLNGEMVLIHKQTLKRYEKSFQEKVTYANNMTGIKINDFWGLIDAQSNQILEPIYDSISCSKDNQCIVEKNGEIGLFRITDE